MSPPAETTWLYGPAGGVPTLMARRAGVDMTISLHERRGFVSAGLTGGPQLARTRLEFRRCRTGGFRRCQRVAGVRSRRPRRDDGLRPVAESVHVRLAQPCVAVHQKIRTDRHRSLPCFLADVVKDLARLLRLVSCPLGVVEVAASAPDVIDDEP